MMKFLNKIVFIFLFCLHIFFLLSLNSCKKESSEPNWDVNLLAPLAKATLTVDNIIADTLKKVNPDNSISLVYQSGLYKFSLDTLFKIPDTTVNYVAKLSNLDLGTINITHRTSFGDIANKDKEDNGPNSSLYQSIMNAHNSGMPTQIDPITEQQFDSVAIDASQYFQTVTLSQGFLDIKIDNQLPVSITNLIFEVRNQSTNIVVVQDTFPFISPFSQAEKTKSLAGLTVEGHMLGMVKLSSPGGEVTLDTSMAITAQISIYDLQVQSAIASFPGQNVVDKKEKTAFKINDVQLSRVLARSGNINIDVYNTLHETLHFNYKVYSATKNNIPLEINGTIPQAFNGNVSHISVNKNLQGYDFNLKGIGPVEQIYGDQNGNGFIDPDTVNTIFSTLVGSIDSSGNQIPLSMQDSIYFHCSFTNLSPDYVQGYLGRDTISESSAIETNILNEFVGASLNFNDVKVSLVVSNQIGISGKVMVNELKAINTSNNQSATLSFTLPVNPFSIAKPVNPNSTLIDVTPTINTLQLNNTNSNINSLINVVPNKINYSVQVYTNYNIPPPIPGTGADFIYYGDQISANLEVEVPLSVIASNVTLCDTSTFSLGKTNTDKITGGNLILFVDNEFPVEANPQVYLLDSNNAVLDIIIPSGAVVLAGDVNTTTERVTTAKRTKISVPITEARLEKLKKTKRIRATASFITRPQNQHVKIYNDYTMRFKVVGDFSYKLH
ncbi:MAG: hypothetical protein HY958_10725 [Bacteroidia bacterium]|nr:hypothetical protein [Bacteroidia bacterium]